MDDIKSSPTASEYIREGEGAIGKLGRAGEVLWDYAGYLKNKLTGPGMSALGDKAARVPGARWIDSRVKVTDDQVNRVIEVVKKSLEDPNYVPTAPEQKAMEYLRKLTTFGVGTNQGE
jgi:hypothetical protein